MKKIFYLLCVLAGVALAAPFSVSAQTYYPYTYAQYTYPSQYQQYYYQYPYQYGYQYSYPYSYQYAQYYPCSYGSNYCYTYQYQNNYYPYYWYQPVISNVSGPSYIRAGTLGTWTINLSTNSQYQGYTTNVRWGDEYAYGYMYPYQYPNTSYSLTVSHVYYYPGTYTASFTVRNVFGGQGVVTKAIVVY